MKELSRQVARHMTLLTVDEYFTTKMHCKRDPVRSRGGGRRRLVTPPCWALVACPVRGVCGAQAGPNGYALVPCATAITHPRRDRTYGVAPNKYTESVALAAVVHCSQCGTYASRDCNAAHNMRRCVLSIIATGERPADLRRQPVADGRARASKRPRSVNGAPVSANKRARGPRDPMTPKLAAAVSAPPPPPRPGGREGTRARTAAA